MVTECLATDCLGETVLCNMSGQATEWWFDWERFWVTWYSGTIWNSVALGTGSLGTWSLVTWSPGHSVT
jgi:hypothetical protein